MILFVYGDSISLGLWDAKGGWVDRLKAKIFEVEIQNKLQSYNELYNLGIDGNFTSQVVKRFDSETEARLWPGEENAFIFATGINDTLFRKTQGEVSNPVKYKSELETLLKKAKKYSNKIVFLDLTPVDETRTNPLPPEISSSGKSYSNERIDMFNETLYEFCDKNQIICIKVNEQFKKEESYEKLLIDGLHPNNDGHELIFNTVWETINNLWFTS